MVLSAWRHQNTLETHLAAKGALHIILGHSYTDDPYLRRYSEGLRFKLDNHMVAYNMVNRLDQIRRFFRKPKPGGAVTLLTWIPPVHPAYLEYILEPMRLVLNIIDDRKLARSIRKKLRPVPGPKVNLLMV
jgi:hypothetical protein